MVGIAQLVERQVVALEVEGSSPSSYPISANVNTLIKLNFLLKTSSLSNLQKGNIHSYYTLITLNNKLHANKPIKKFVRGKNNRLDS